MTMTIIIIYDDRYLGSVIIIIAFINVRIADRQLANGTWWSSLLFRHLSWALGAGRDDDDGL